MTEQPPGGYPPPPPGGYPPPPPGGNPPPGGSFDMAAAFNWTFRKFGQHAAVLIGLAAVVFVVRLINIIVDRIIINAINNCDNPTVTITDSGIRVDNCGGSFWGQIAATSLTAIVFGIITGILILGIYRAALKITKGEQPSFGDLTERHNLGIAILVSIVFYVLLTVGIVLCIIPGILVAFFFQLAVFYALDRGEGVGAAFSHSGRAIMNNIGPAVIMTLVVFVSSILGSGLLWFTFGILTLVTLPIAALYVAYHYRAFNHEPIAP